MKDGPPRLTPLNDQSEAPRGFADQGVVVEHQAQAQQAIEPVGALFQRPAGAVGDGAGGVHWRAFPGVAEGGTIFVKMAGDAPAGRQGPVAEPAGRLDGAGRERQQGRRRGRGVRTRVGRGLGVGRPARPADPQKPNDRRQQQRGSPRGRRPADRSNTKIATHGFCSSVHHWFLSRKDTAERVDRNEPRRTHSVERRSQYSTGRDRSQPIIGTHPDIQPATARKTGDRLTVAMCR